MRRKREHGCYWGAKIDPTETNIFVSFLRVLEGSQSASQLSEACCSATSCGAGEILG